MGRVKELKHVVENKPDYRVSMKKVPAKPKHGMRQSLAITNEYEIIRLEDNKRFTITGYAEYKNWEKKKIKDGKKIQIGSDD